MMVLRGVHPVSGRLVPAVWVAATARRVAVAGRAITPFNFGPTITAELANYCGTGGAVCGESDGKSIASDSYAGVRYGSGAYGHGAAGIFRATTTRAGPFAPNRFGPYDMHGNVWDTASIRRRKIMPTCRLTAPRARGIAERASDTARRILVAQPRDLPLRLPGQHRSGFFGVARPHRSSGHVHALGEGASIYG